MTNFIAVTLVKKTGVTSSGLLNVAAIASMESNSLPDGGQGTRLTMVNGNVFLTEDTITELFEHSDALASI